MSKTCLICSRSTDNDIEYHARCSKIFFGVFPPPILDLTLENVQDFAAKSILSRITVTGVQKKLSLGIEESGNSTRLTVVGLWGKFILKPPSDEYPDLPENEDTIMNMASVINIPVVPHAMIRLLSGELAYITRRIDRDEDDWKIAMEDFCQISERLTEDKYKGSVERIGKLLRKHSIYPGLDIIDLFERVVFNFIAGNSDMHLKNYSLIETPKGMRLSPAYDLLSTVLVIPEDWEESALTINGKKSNLKKADFNTLAESMGIGQAASLKVYKKIIRAKGKLTDVIDSGRLPKVMKKRLKEIIEIRMNIFE